MLGRSNRILMASYRKCGNKLSCTVAATEIERIRKDKVTWLTFDRRIFEIKAKTGS